MTFLLAQIRRFFLAGIIALSVVVLWVGKSLGSIIDIGLAFNGIESYFYALVVLSPIAFLLFTIISVVYIRNKGQFAAVHKSQSPFVSFFRCLGHDLISPFKNVAQFFAVIFKRTPALDPEEIIEQANKKIIGRFIWMVICVGFYATMVILIKMGLL